MPIVVLADVPLPDPAPIGGSFTVSDGDAAKTSRTYAPGDSTGVAAKLAENAARADLLALYSGLPRVAQGLTLTMPTSLSATVAAGVAFSQGVIVLEANRTAISLVNNATNYLWIRQQVSGTSPEILTDTVATAPSGDAVYLGSIETLAGALVAIDYSGVIYSKGGQAWMETGDTGEPAATPPAGFSLLCKTAGGLWFWDGDAWYKLVSGGVSATVPLAKLTGGGSNGTLTIVDGIITAHTDPT